MRIEVRNYEYEATPDNTHIFIGETLLNGVYTDLDDDYVFIPQSESRDYVKLAVGLKKEGVEYSKLQEYDPEEEPYCYMINALCRQFRNEIDYIEIGDES